MPQGTEETEVKEQGPLTPRELASDWPDQVRFYIYSVLLIILMLTGYLWNRILITVPAGHHGILFDRFRGGTLIEPVYSEGLHLVWPWNTLIFYETRMQQRALKLQVLSAEGLSLSIGLSIRYSPVVANLGYLHHDVGPDYFDRLIKPDIEGHLRHTFGGRPAHEIYSSAREVLQEISRVPLLGRLTGARGLGGEQLTDPYLRLEDIKLVEVELPPLLVAAINNKQKQEQLTLEYKHRLEREGKEADRKRTEASGIRDYSLIAGKISSDVLRWRGIDAAVDLAKSSNSKVIIFGNGTAGGPVMLNVTDAPAGPSAAPTVPAPVERPPQKRARAEKANPTEKGNATESADPQDKVRSQ